MKKHLFLIGPPAAGKSSAGAVVAEKMQMRFIDLDRRIEAANQTSIAGAFEAGGELAFRAMETEALRGLIAESPRGVVVATGAGAALACANRELLKAHGVVFYLHATVEAQSRRLRDGHGAGRPLLAGADLPMRLAELARDRTDLYQELADFSIETSDKTIAEVAAEICALAERMHLVQTPEP